MSPSTRLVRAAVLASLGGALAFTSIPPTGAGWILALALIVGLPHGALDHELHPGQSSRRGQAEFHLGYLLVVGAMVLAWFVAPTAAFVVFLVASALHFGQSDLLHDHTLHAAPAVVATRGALIVFAPLVAEPDVARALFSMGTTPVMDLPLPTVGQPVAVVVALVVHVLALLHRIGLKPRMVEHATDAFAIALVMTGAGTTLGLAIYFALWHTPDHFAAVDRPAGDLFRAAVPRTLATAAAVGLAAVFFDPESWPRLMVLAIAVLSIPHALVVHLAVPMRRLGARPNPEMEFPA